MHINKPMFIRFSNRLLSPILLKFSSPRNVRAIINIVIPLEFSLYIIPIVNYRSSGHIKSMLDRRHIKQMFDRYDAFNVSGKSIRSESTLSETNSSQVVSICCSQPGWCGHMWCIRNTRVGSLYYITVILIKRNRPVCSGWDVMV